MIHVWLPEINEGLIETCCVSCTHPEGLLARNNIAEVALPDMGLGRLIETLKMCLGKRNSAYPRYENWDDDQIPPHQHSHKIKPWDSLDQNLTEPVCHKCQGRSHRQVGCLFINKHVCSHAICVFTKE